MAAVLACGPEAVLSHRSAAALWGLWEGQQVSVDVTAPGRRGRLPRRYRCSSPRIAVVRRTGRWWTAFPAPAVATTLLDLAGGGARRELRERGRAGRGASRVFDLGAVRELIERSGGAGVLRGCDRSSTSIDPRSERTRSELERRFLGCAAGPACTSRRSTCPLDLGGSPDKPTSSGATPGLIVETDGRRFHDTDSAFVDDRRREQRLQLAGWRVIRCTWGQVDREPARARRRPIRASASARPTGRDLRCRRGSRPIGG